MAARIATRFDPDRPIRAGQPIPAFELPSLDDPKVRITRDLLHGKLVLIELWATWCKPCVAEMPNVQAAYTAFRDRGLTIVSINTADAPAVVREFRKAKWPMPWHNVVLEDPHQAEAVTKTFGAFTLPTSILVDAKGTN